MVNLQLVQRGVMKMHIIHEKEYEKTQEIGELKFVSYNSNGTLSLVLEDGTYYNFRNKELKMIIDFLRRIE